MTDEFSLPGVDEADDLNPVETAESVAAIDATEAPPETDAAVIRPPGPGLPESLGWTLFVFLTIQAIGLVWLFGFIAYLNSQGFGLPGLTPNGMNSYILSLPINDRILLLLPPNLIAFSMLIPLGLLRLGRRRLKKLNFSLPSLTQLLILLAVVNPTSMVATPLYVEADEAWISACEGIPALEEFNRSASMMKIAEYFQRGSLGLLLFLLAVVPAVGEEFVFRGVVGRGLVARWGLWPGILITSFLFALVHGYPPHIVAVFPIGVMMHIVYLATRSFWMPVFFHFANNGMGALQLALGVNTDEGSSVWLAFAAFSYMALSVFLLYRYRTRYVDEDGQDISPGYLTVEEPPPEAGARRFAPTGWIVAPLMALIVAGTAVYIGVDLAQSLPEPPDAFEAETANADNDQQQVQLVRHHEFNCDPGCLGSIHSSSDRRIQA